MSAFYQISSHTQGSDQKPFKKTLAQHLDALLYQAVQAKASDMHFRPTDDGVTLYLRVDGDLRQVEVVSNQKRAALCARIKVLAGLDIAQVRLPQDGNIRIMFKQGEVQQRVDVRVATFPTLFGEKVVLRFLYRTQRYTTMKLLGMNNQLSSLLERDIKRRHGLFLVTGPTGSGKTTTLYTLLSMLDHKKRNIVTLEDPVEAFIAGTTQSEVKPEIGFTFDVGLRSLVRQDPDVIMVGEIRDSVTAQIAVRAALTGHMVLSTLHTNTAASCVTRLLEMGIEPYLLGSSLVGVVAQRLVQLMCQKCKVQQDGYWRASGCNACNGLAISGRTGLFEYLPVGKRVQQNIIRNARSHLFEYAVQRHRVCTLRKNATELYELGRISYSEFLSVCSMDESMSKSE